MDRQEGGPAHPVQASDGSLYSGMTLRDYFAGQALQIFIMGKPEIESMLAGATPRHDIVAKFCYNLADAMLEERNKG